MWPFSNSYPTCTPAEIDGAEFDFIVIGGGTAGCVVASRLSEDPTLKVLVIERGDLVDTWASHVPLLSANFNAKTAPVYRWSSAPGLTSLKHGPLGMISGKAMGGTSKINVSVYHRSIPAEYNAWAAAGREGWSWEHVEPFFKLSENSLSDNSSDRGHTGPWVNQRVEPIAYKFSQCLVTASSALGLPICETINRPSASAVACIRTDVTIDERGRRRSTFDSFLPTSIVKSRVKNLKLCPQTVVTSITFEHNPQGVRASGVMIETESTFIPHPPRRVYAKREVILCAGAIATPHLLLISGVGPAQELRELRVDVVFDHPNVGKGLQDHLAVPLVWTAPRRDTAYELRENILFVLREFIRYIFWTRGFFLLPIAQVFVFARSALLDESSITKGSPKDFDGHSPDNIPDIEIIPSPTAAINKPEVQAMAKDGATSLLCVLLRPRSMGEITLSNMDPRARPKCNFNALHDAEDMARMKKAVRLGLALGEKIRESGYPLGNFLFGTTGTDQDIERHIRETLMSTFHYASSCRMAPLADGGVVDDQLRVHGIDGLRIADCSVFPTIPAGHLQAPAVMIGERCAAFLKADTRH